MGRASTTSKDFPSGGRRRPRHGSRSAGREWEFQHVSIGNPQCAIVVDAASSTSSTSARSAPRSKATTLFPNRTNVSFLAIDGSRVRARIFERGVGETLSSGTGASGAAVTAFLRGAPSPITVELDGGELEVEIGEDLGGAARRLGRAGLRGRALAGAARRARRAGLTDRSSYR